MSDFEAGDLPPDVSDLADRLRSNRYDASALELDAIKTGILKRGSGRRVARGRRMRKRTFVTALIMFAAIGTGSAGAVGFGGHFFSFANFFKPRPAPTVVTLAAPAAPSISAGAAAATPAARVAPAALTPTAFCAQYTCATSTTIACSPLLTFFGFTLPAVCRVTVTNLTNTATPTGTVVVTATGGPTTVCTLGPSFGPSATCTVAYGRFNPGNLTRGFIRFGSSTVTASYLGGGGLQPSSGSTRMFVTVFGF
jgi:hypothetical protein